MWGCGGGVSFPTYEHAEKVGGVFATGVALEVCCYVFPELLKLIGWFCCADVVYVDRYDCVLFVNNAGPGADYIHCAWSNFSVKSLVQM